MKGDAERHRRSREEMSAPDQPAVKEGDAEKRDRRLETFTAG